MSAAPTLKLTPAEYLAIERKAEFKSEYYAGEMFAMAGSPFLHNLIKDNLIGWLGEQLKHGSCRTVSSDQRVKVAETGLYTYPDIIILCEPPQFEDNEQDILLNPRVIVEIMSESTEKYDRGEKARHYKRIASLHEFALVSQSKPIVDRFVRLDHGTWNLKDYSGLDATLEFASVPAKIALAEIYRGVEFPEPKLR